MGSMENPTVDLDDGRDCLRCGAASKSPLFDSARFHRDFRARAEKT